MCKNKIYHVIKTGHLANSKTGKENEGLNQTIDLRRTIITNYSHNFNILLHDFFNYLTIELLMLTTCKAYVLVGIKRNDRFRKVGID
jgi:hypothetical protein